MWSQLSSHLPQSLQSYADIDALKAKAQAIKGQLTEGLAEVLQDIEESEQVAKDNIEKYREQKRIQEFEQQQLGEHQDNHQHDTENSLVTPNGAGVGKHFMDNFGSSSSSLLDTSLYSNPNGTVASELSPTATLAASTHSIESNPSSFMPHASTHSPLNHHMNHSAATTDEHGALAVEAALDHSSPLDESFDANSTSLSTSTVLNQSTVDSDSETAHRSAQSQAALAELQAKLAQVQSLWFQAQADNASLKTNYESRVQSLLAESQRKDEQLMESQKNAADIRSKMLNQLEDKEHELQRIQTSYAQLMQKQTDLASISQPAAPTIASSPAASPIGGAEEEEESLDVQAMLSDVSLPTEEKISMLVEEIDMLTNRAKHWKLKAKSTPSAPVATEAVAPAAAPASVVAEEAQSSELQDQIDDLTSRLESITDERDTLTEILNELKAESEKSLQEQAVKFQSEFQQLQQQIHELRAENVGLLHQLQSVAPVGADLSSEVAALQQALAAMKSENVSLRSQHEADEHALSELHQQLTQERNSRPLNSPHHPASSGISQLNESHSELPTPAFSAPPSPLHGSFSKDPWTHDATTDLGPQLASLQEQYNALLKSHDKLSLFRSQAVTWKKAAEQSLLKLKGRKMDLEAKLQRHDERHEREKQELIKHINHWKTQALAANPESTPYPSHSDILSSPASPSPSPAHSISSGEAAAPELLVNTESPSTATAALSGAMDLMKTEHAAALALKDAQFDLARQQLSMQSEQISVLQSKIAEMTQQVQQNVDRDRINEERIRAEYVLVTDDMAQRIQQGAQALATRENEIVEKNLQLTRLSSEIQTLKMQIQQLQDANQIAANHAQQMLTQEIATRTQEWQKQLQQSQSELQQLQSQLQNSHSQKDEELAQLQTKLQEAGNQLSMTNQMAQFLQTQLEEQRRTVQSKDGEIQQLQSQLVAASSDSSSVTQGLNERINQLTQHLMQAEREVAEGRLTIESMEPRIFLAEGNATAAENALNEANARAEKAELQLQEANANLEAANIKAELAAAALAEANVRAEHAGAGVNETTAKAEIAAAALAEANERAEDAAAALAEANNRVEAISSALAEANTRADTIAAEAQQQVAAAMAEANAAKEQASQAAAQATAVPAPAPVASSPAADTSALEQRNTELQTQLSELQQKHSTKIEQANQMLNQGQQRYDSLMASFTSLQQKCRDGMQGEEGNMATIAALEADALDLRQKLQAQSEEFEKAKADAKKADQYKNELTILTMRWKEAVSEADGVRKLMKDQMAAVAAAAAERAANGENGVGMGVIDPEEVHALKQQIQNLKLDAASMESLQSDYASLQRNFDMNQSMLSEARGNLEEVRAALTHTQNRLTIAEQQYAELQQSKNVAQSQQDAVVVEASSKQLSDLQQALQHKQNQLLEMQNYTSSLEKDNLNLRKNFESTMAKLKNFSSDEHLVDRRLVVKMLVTYFERKDKDEVLSLMAKMLQFTPDDIKRINKGRQGYLGAAWNFLASPVAIEQNSADPNSNLADSWIDFLMQESNKAEQEKTAAEAAAQVQLQAAPTRPQQQRFTPSMPNESEFESRPSRPLNLPTSLPPPMMSPPQFSIPPLGSMPPPVGGVPQPQQFQQAPPPPWAVQQTQLPVPIQQQPTAQQQPLQPLQPFPPAFSVPNPAFHPGAAQIAPPAFAVPPPAFHPAAPGFTAPPPMFAVPPPIGFPMQPPPAMNGVHQ